jgi:transposase-like protein
MENKFSIKQFNQRFPDDASCLEEIKQLRFGNTLPCPKCAKENKFYRVSGRSAYACSFCGHHIYPLKDSIFDHSSTELKLWFYAIYLMAQTRAGISAKQLERELGVTYKTAWRMFNHIRQLMASGGNILTGEVEVDEAYFHPNPQKRTTAKAHNSQIVFGMVERKGRAVVKHVKSSGVRVLSKEISSGIASDATIYSDTHRSYKHLTKVGYVHFTINHSQQEYVNGNRHTQNVENLWSNIKRGITGVYRHVDPKYLQNYIDEYAFRYSHRQTPKYMFDLILSNIAK